MIRRSTWAALFVLAILIGAVFYLQNQEPEAGEQVLEEIEEDRAFSITLENVLGLRVVGSDGKIFYATRSGTESWTLVQPEISSELDSILLESYVSQFISLTPLSRLEAGLGLEALGLISPQYTIRLSLVDGGEKFLEIGELTPTGSGYYTRLDNTDLIVIPTYNLESILALVEKPPLLPTPTPLSSPTPMDQVDPETQTTNTPEP
jgi:hypothetical protein